jgi:hypothetical protein
LRGGFFSSHVEREDQRPDPGTPIKLDLINGIDVLDDLETVFV